MGWAIRSARLGVIWGLTAALGVFSLGAMVSAAGLRVAPTVEMWAPGSNIAEADLLLMTVNQISDWSNKNINSQPVTIVGVDSPALEWLLRGHELSVVRSLDASAAPAMVISTDANDPQLAAGYRGQSFVWRQKPAWSEARFVDFLRWTAFHDLLQNSETLIVWVRSDLFLDSTGTTP